MGRPFHVYDYEGEHLGAFPSWERAHEWAHLQAVLNGVPTPLEVEDRSTSSRRRVWADRCEPVGAGASNPGAPASTGTHAQVQSEAHVDAETDLLAAGRCAAVRAPVFAPPHPRQSTEYADGFVADGVLAEGAHTARTDAARIER
ncbi:hypothetical protein ACG83_02805 [Frankia sp. R43]|uniref:hypothetical protein n=1 Tax=Frankia sp. R43 TaxID=269536 RepID=UPI0006CA3A25|nr:hypothetical protein [Frankia sp. R43]KPM56809.1 hypothetical protein ACG83_02805 [Frankia sp. R43]